jgi:CheY-like chemotaxis protein
MSGRKTKPTEAPPSSEPAPVFHSGELLADTYEVRALLGTGGMGEVYEAHDRVLNRRVAIKIVRPGLTSDYLLREGRALAAIHHPGVVGVHTMGVHRGVAHRDVKPGNVMLAPGGRIVLMDFGLVLPQADRAGHRSVAGSLQYMPPEALTGDTAEGAATLGDVYALGVLGFELLTGIEPFDGAEPLDLYRAKTHPKQPRVSEHRTDVPVQLDELIAYLMAPGPDDRPQGAEAAVWALRAMRARLGNGGALRPLSVLIVDDDADMREALALYVRAAAPDAEVESTQGGRQALKSVRRRVPDLLLLDLDLPDINGIEVCMLLRGMQLGDSCMIVSVSGRATRADVELLQQLGVQSLEKGPALMTELVQLVQKLRPGLK